MEMKGAERAGQLVCPEPAGLLDRFWRSAVLMAGAAEQERRRHAQDAADVIVQLGGREAAIELASILRPDLETGDVTWTIACFELGSVAPCGLHEVHDPVDAVAMLVDCQHDDHVASELVCTGGDGLQWVALYRADHRIEFQLPDLDNLSAPESETTAIALQRWQRHISYHRLRLDDHVDPGATTPAEVDEHVTPASRPALRTPPLPSRAVRADVADARSRLRKHAETRADRSDAPLASSVHDNRPVTVGSLATALRSAVAEVVPLLERYLLDAVAEAVSDAGTALPGDPSRLGAIRTQISAELANLPRAVAAEVDRRADGRNDVVTQDVAAEVQRRTDRRIEILTHDIEVTVGSLLRDERLGDLPAAVADEVERRLHLERIHRRLDVLDRSGEARLDEIRQDQRHIRDLLEDLLLARSTPEPVATPAPVDLTTLHAEMEQLRTEVHRLRAALLG